VDVYLFITHVEAFRLAHAIPKWN